MELGLGVVTGCTQAPCRVRVDIFYLIGNEC